MSMKKIRILHLEDVQSDADLIHRTLRKILNLNVN